jgi:hypothetical protein
MPDLIPIVQWDRNPKSGQVQGEPPYFYLTPLLFFPEFIQWNPMQAKGSAPAIVDRSTDPNSRIAQRARSGNRTDPYPGNQQWFISYVEHLNFVCVLFDEAGDQIGEKPIVISFARGEHKAGREFASLVKSRRKPIFGCRFKATVAKRSNEKGNWYGFDLTNADDEIGPWIQDAEQFAAYQAMHVELNENYKASKIRVDYDDDVIDNNGGATTDTFDPQAAM